MEIVFEMSVQVQGRNEMIQPKFWCHAFFLNQQLMHFCTGVSLNIHSFICEQSMSNVKCHLQSDYRYENW